MSSKTMATRSISIYKYMKNVKKYEKQVISFVEELEHRKGYCNEIELFKLLHIWLLVFEDVERYDNLSPVKQFERMWRDIKMVYVNIQFLNRPKDIEKFKRCINDIREKEMVDVCQNICKMISTGNYTLKQACHENGTNEAAFQVMRFKYTFLNEEYKKSKNLKSKNLKNRKKYPYVKKSSLKTNI